MGFLKKGTNALKGKTIKAVEGMARKGVEAKTKGKSLDELALMTMKLIPAVSAFPGGFANMRKQVLEGIESEIQDLVKEGKTDAEIISPVLASANYITMLGKLDLSLIHIKEAVRQAREAAV